MATKPPESTDYSFFILFRILFGVCLAESAAQDLFSSYWRQTLLWPKFHFHYAGFGWVQPLPEPYLLAGYILFILSCLLFSAGLFQRATSAFNLLFYSYTVLLEKAVYNNHYYLIAILCFFFCLLPVENPARGEKPSGPGWFLDLFRYQFAIVYFFAGVAKWNRDWLLGEPLGQWLHPISESYRLPLLMDPYVVSFMAISGLLLDLLVGPALLYQRTRYPAMLLLIAFHCSNEAMFEIGVFPAMMVASCLLFLGPPPVPRLAWKSPAARFAALFLLVQCLLPLRHFAIPGMSAWTDDGHRYAWRMKLRSKRPMLKSLLIDAKPVDPRRYLTPGQIQRMSSRPDMIVEFVDYLKREEGVDSVRMLITARLNGRPEQTFVHPGVELTKVEFSAFSPTDWVEPLEQPYLEKSAKYSYRVVLGFLYALATVQLVLSLLQGRKKRDWKSVSVWGGAGAVFMLGSYYLFSHLSPALLATGWLLVAGLWGWGLSRKTEWFHSTLLVGQTVLLLLFSSILYLYPTLTL